MSEWLSVWVGECPVDCEHGSNVTDGDVLESPSPSGRLIIWMVKNDENN